MSIARALAGAMFSCCILMAAPASAASRAEGAERADTHSDMLDQDAGRMATAERLSYDWLQTIATNRVRSDRGRVSASADMIADLMSPALQGSAAVLSPQLPRSNSTVPLPTGLSLFGAGLLTLGLIGFVSGAPRRLALETGCVADLDSGPGPDEAIPSTRFRIEIQSDRGCQVRHIVSARGTIDAIADLLNEGWEIVSIHDRHGSSLDYEDILDAWHSERADAQKRIASLS